MFPHPVDQISPETRQSVAVSVSLTVAPTNLCGLESSGSLLEQQLHQAPFQWSL